MSEFFALHVHDYFLICVCVYIYIYIYIYVIVVLVGMWALRNLLHRAVHVFSSCLVCFEELTFLLMFFPKWLRDKQSTL